MTPRGLARLLLAWGLLTIALAAGAHAWSRGSVVRGTFLATAWVAGAFDGRASGTSPEAARTALGPTFARIAVDEVTAEGPLPPGPLVAFAFAPNVDGAVVRAGSKTVYLTPDELRGARIYDVAFGAPEMGSGFGVSMPLLVDLAAARLGLPPAELARTATVRRARMRPVLETKDPAPSSAEVVRSASLLRARAMEAAYYLVRNQDDAGRYRYLVRAETNAALGGYNWPRHAGATLFLAEAALASSDPALGAAAARGGAYLRTASLGDCGGRRCAMEDGVPGFGASALALLAFAAIAPLDILGGPPAREEVAKLAAFLRSQQRPDGEFAHEYDLSRHAPVDVQYMYYTGEAALALSRAHRLTGDPQDLDAARRALSHLVRRAWSFFGNRYWVAEEHWTCQAMEDLWDRAADREAFAFCLRWQEVQRALQGPPRAEGELAQDLEGSFGITPFFSPRLTPTASRAEASVATLNVLLAAEPTDGAQAAAIRASTARALGLVVREQLLPGPSHAFRDPSAVSGAVPGSPVDLDLRIDYAQHAGSAMLRYATFLSRHPE